MHRDFNLLNHHKSIFKMQKLKAEPSNNNRLFFLDVQSTESSKLRFYCTCTYTNHNSNYEFELHSNNELLNLNKSPQGIQDPTCVTTLKLLKGRSCTYPIIRMYTYIWAHTKLFCAPSIPDS